MWAGCWRDSPKAANRGIPHAHFAGWKVAGVPGSKQLYGDFGGVVAYGDHGEQAGVVGADADDG
jgi:hypothetical protein